MSEYVSKKELKEFFESIEITVTGRARAKAIGEVLQAIYNGVMELPTTDAEPVRRGKWELAEDGWYCSACELYPPFDCDPEEKGIPYCPNCGARMDKE